jgi:hypothetical protein
MSCCQSAQTVEPEGAVPPSWPSDTSPNPGKHPLGRWTGFSEDDDNQKRLRRSETPAATRRPPHSSAIRPKGGRPNPRWFLALAAPHPGYPPFATSNPCESAETSLEMEPQAKRLAKIGRRISASRDYEPLLQRIADRHLVLIGEASHGTHEFCQVRAAVSSHRSTQIFADQVGTALRAVPHIMRRGGGSAAPKRQCGSHRW